MSARRITLPLAAFILLAAYGVVFPVLGRDAEPRRSARPRTWQKDERQQPRYAERQTHRGYEVASGPITVVAMTGREDARQVSQQALQAWNQMAQLADRFTSVHRAENFAQGAVQIVVDRGPIAGDQQRRVRVTPLNQTTQITVFVSARDDTIDRHFDEIRRGAAWALLRTAELDRRLPAWVCQGLATFAGNGPAKDADGEESAQLVTFLLTGNDGRHAADFLAAVRAQATAPTGGSLDTIVSEFAGQFAAWKEDPQIGQPLWHSPEDAESSVSDAQRAMLFPLKLAERFAEAQQPAVRTRITTFDKQRGVSVVQQGSAARPPPIQSLVDRITRQEQPWASLGPDGELIWSSETEKIEKLLGVDEGRYQHVWHEGRWALETTLDDGRTLRGWLEPNRDRPTRPVARFVVQEPELR